MAKDKGITVKKEDDISEWYSQVIAKAEIADYAPVRGCMIIRPYGYAIWENLMDYFNKRIREHGVQNAYFPVFIPESFFQKEAEHAEGFKPEVAWVEKKESESGDRLALRPTSETIMYDSFGKWIRSWRDLPFKTGQWCNIIRWEVKDVKMFLRSREFLWHEGHCAYETEEERNEETQTYLKEYKTLAEELLAVPVIAGEKSVKERFAGADRTFTIEGYMPDGKALQMGTSHDLSQGFSKAFNIEFLGRDEKKHHVFQNSWGISTRLMGAFILVHSDDKGLVVPPRIAPIKSVLVPILFDDTKEAVLEKSKEIVDSLKAKGVDCKLDDRDGYSPGWKFNEWEMKGIPVRIEFGPKDLEKGQVMLARRDTGEKTPCPIDQVSEKVEALLEDIHKNLFDTAQKRWDENKIEVDNWDDFMKGIESRKFVLAAHCGEKSCEETIKEETSGATTRVIISRDEGCKCFKCGKDAAYKIYFAKNY